VASARSFERTGAAPAAAPPVPPPPVEASAALAQQPEAVAPVEAGGSKTLLFESGSVALTAAARGTLNALVRRMRSEPALGLIVEGHSDATGPEELNRRLSQQRAQAVADYLVSRQGIPRQRVHVEFFGSSRPADSSGTPAALRANRRVVLVWK
jgi:outer membrane protein OmpA-like peptidoglycan-associated protein